MFTETEINCRKGWQIQCRSEWCGDSRAKKKSKCWDKQAEQQRKVLSTKMRARNTKYQGYFNKPRRTQIKTRVHKPWQIDWTKTCQYQTTKRGRESIFRLVLFKIDFAVGMNEALYVFLCITSKSFFKRRVKKVFMGRERSSWILFS